MNILIIGGTGTVGSEVVKRLTQKDVKKIKVKVMTRSPEKISGLPGNVEGVVGDLDKIETLEKAFRKIDRLFLVTTPASMDETQSGLNAVEAAKNEGIHKMVYMSAFDLESLKDVPHLYGKIPIENAIKSSGMAYTLLRPNGFFQNDYWFKERIMELGVYGQPTGEIGLNRVDVRDIADAAVKSLLTDDFNGKTYPLVGPDLLNGHETAQLFSKYLDSKIIYTGDDLETWAAQQKQFLPERIVDDLRAMYNHFLEKGYKATKKDLEETREILGQKPSGYEPFVKEVASQWKK